MNFLHSVFSAKKNDASLKFYLKKNHQMMKTGEEKKN